MPKGFKISQPIQKIQGDSEVQRTFGHPVVKTCAYKLTVGFSDTFANPQNGVTVSTPFSIYVHWPSSPLALL